MCHQQVEATTADVLISFQKVPGVDAASIIDGGAATLEGSDTPVRPQGNGYYGLRMSAGSTSRLTFLGTTYVIRHIQGEVNEPDHGSDIVLASWETLGANDANSGIGHAMQAGTQRRLQLLGYYTGKVDGIMGKKSEVAILRFQADNNLRTDAEVGSNTRTALNTVTTNDNTTDSTHIVRRSLIRFERAPHRTNATRTHGRPRSTAPDPDYRGFIEVPTVGTDLKGPAVSMARETNFRIKVIRECIADDVTLVATSEDESLVRVRSAGPLPNERQMILQLRAEAIEGRNPRNTSVKINVRRGEDLTEIASLQVVVLPLITKEIRPYWVTIDGAAHIVNGANLSGPTAPVGTRGNIESAIDAANNILWSHGLYFRRLGWREKSVTLSHAGQITWANVVAEYRTINEANDSAGHATEDDKINLYIVRNIDGALGMSFSTRRYDWPYIGIAVRSTGGLKNTTPVEIGQTIAHELGHFMGLSDYFVTPPLAHSEDDPNDSNKKTDIWSLKRMMYGSWPTGARPADGWAHNPGYGNDNGGGMISIRNLPADRTDNECALARRHTASADFYRDS